MNVANKSIICKLTMRFLRAGRTRNIIVVIAIALTAVMFTSVFTIGGNMICAIVPAACYKWMIRDSLVERLRVE